VQLARLGKAATAFVEVKAARGQGAGSAFCIHPDGWFVTNAHVAQGKITLVLNPSLRTEKVYRARVVRSDSELDLALLKIEGEQDLAALTLGTDEGLEEQMDAMAFGFPLVGSQAPGKPGYPTISVNSGSITALRRKQGQLKHIELDAELNPGNSGGPVLDNQGKVIGVVRSGLVAQGLGRTGINQAIPVSAVRHFLARPVFSFRASQAEGIMPGEQVEFVAKITELVPTAAPRDLALVLGAGTPFPRRVGMNASGGEYRARAVPFVEGRRKIEVSVVRCNLVLRHGEEDIDVESLSVFAAGAERPSFQALREGRFVPPPRSTAPVSYLRFESPSGDFIGQGKSYSYEEGDLTLRSYQGGVQCEVQDPGNWTLLFGAGRGRNLDVAEYRGAKRHPAREESPGIELTGNSRGCGRISGEFRVWEYEQKGNTVVRFAVDFVQRCEETMPPIVGMLRYNSTFD
jgi:hypothetical protein